MKKKWIWAMLLAIASFLLIIFLILPGIFSKELEPKALEPTPNKAQLDWQELEYYMFIHFGPNTFTNVEWGDGKENPKVFNPSDMDIRQWASVAKDAGMTGIVITAKHHDGFCLWPSEYSTHTVKESPWKDGKGDVLKDLSEACKEYGLKFGVYLSPWDQNHPAYGTAEYNSIFAKTLEEVLTNYGEVYEQWFDGANGGNVKHAYDWDLFHETVYKHQPNAIIFSDIGPDIRWIGNERGYAGETNWSKIDTTGYGPGAAAPDRKILNEGLITGEAWVAGEVDVSIRPGWFYSPETDDRVKSVEHLMDIYYGSVGRNANLLLNVPPDRRGRIHPNDSTRLMEFRRAREADFEKNIAEGATVVASNTRGDSKRYSANNLLDGNKKTYWSTNDDVATVSLEISLQEKSEVNRILLQEFIKLGQRVASFDVEYWDDATDKWLNIATATTIGYKRILRFPTVNTQKIRVNIREVLQAPVCLSNIELYRAKEAVLAPKISRNKSMLEIATTEDKTTIYYTLDGSVPSAKSIKYTEPVELKSATTVKAIATKGEGRMKSEVVKKILDVALANSSVINPKGLDLHSDVLKINKGEALEIDLGEKLNLKGFSYNPDINSSETNVYRYSFYVKLDANGEWVKVMDNASFDNIKNNPIEQRVEFAEAKQARYIKFEPLELTSKGANVYTVLEIAPITR